MTSVVKKLSLLGLGGTVLILIIALFFYSLFLPVSAQKTASKTFVVPKGQAISIIGQRLQQEGLIKNALIFRLIVKRDNLANKIQAGSFELSSNMSPDEIASALTKGTNDVWITIVEGWRIEEIAQMLARQELPEFDSEEFIKLSQGQEGYLYPDTYLIPKLSTASAIYSLLTNTFEKKVTQGLSEEIVASSKSFNEILVMASILEREAKGYEQMRQVAGVLWHRIEIGMPLQADATLQYVRGYNKTEDSWWASPSAEDKQLKSVFNTYQNPGLPPTPIANPGIDAIKAAIDPIETNNLFYIHDRRGNLHFAVTLDEHNQNVQKYLR